LTAEQVIKLSSAEIHEQSKAPQIQAKQPVYSSSMQQESGASH